MYDYKYIQDATTGKWYMQQIPLPWWHRFTTVSELTYKVLWTICASTVVLAATLVVALPHMIDTGRMFSSGQVAWGALGIVMATGHFLVLGLFPKKR